MPTIVNTEQAQAWNGYEGRHWADHQDRWDAINAGFNEPLFAAAKVGEDHRVLDIGCGNGYTTRHAARLATGGHATGLDLSEPMLARARACAAAEHIANVTFEHGDAQVYPLTEGAFDLAISRYGVMFFADPVAAFTNVARSLRPGGRLAFICAADPDANDWIQAMSAMRDHLPIPDFTPGAPGMFSLADPDRIRAVLTAAGFGAITITRVRADAPWGHDAEDVATFLLDTGPGRFLLGRASPDAAGAARQALVGALRDHQRGDGPLVLRSTAWLVSADARPGGTGSTRPGCAGTRWSRG